MGRGRDLSHLHEGLQYDFFLFESIDTLFKSVDGNTWKNVPPNQCLSSQRQPGLVCPAYLQEYFNTKKKKEKDKPGYRSIILYLETAGAV